MQQIQASHSAFAALLGDGSVVTWGDVDASHGGDCSAVQGRLNSGSRSKPLHVLLLPFLKMDLSGLG